MFKSNSGEPYAGKLHVRFLEEFISNCLNLVKKEVNLLMDYWFTRGEDRSEQIKKHIKEAAQSIIDHADDMVNQYDLLIDLKIET